MKAKKASVLVVDDDLHLLRMIRRILELEGYQVLAVTDGETALSTLCEKIPDLVLLDIMMPGLDGVTVCQHIREFSQIPIIMVTAKGGDEEKVRGLDVGADDYITKPFSANELAARVRAVLRRGKQWDAKPEPAFQCEALVVDFISRRVTLDGKEIDLTATEYRLLYYLARYAGRVVTPDTLLRQVWGEEYEGENHLLQVNINRLRKKIGDDAKNHKYLITKPGIGYLVSKPDKQ